MVAEEFAFVSAHSTEIAKVNRQEATGQTKTAAEAHLGISAVLKVLMGRAARGIGYGLRILAMAATMSSRMRRTSVSVGAKATARRLRNSARRIGRGSSADSCSRNP